MGRTFEVTIPKVYIFEEGYGVLVTPIWAGDDENPENDTILDIDVKVVPIREADVSVVGNVPCVPVPNSVNFYSPVGNFEKLGAPGEVEYSDTHDLRDRWFETRKEAEEHAKFTRSRFKHPQPWESFIRV